jgi:hypothetical protein
MVSPSLSSIEPDQSVIELVEITHETPAGGDL